MTSPIQYEPKLRDSKGIHYEANVENANTVPQSCRRWANSPHFLRISGKAAPTCYLGRFQAFRSRFAYNVLPVTEAVFGERYSLLSLLDGKYQMYFHSDIILTPKEPFLIVPISTVRPHSPDLVMTFLVLRARDPQQTVFECVGIATTLGRFRRPGVGEVGWKMPYHPQDMTGPTLFEELEQRGEVREVDILIG